MKAKRIPYSVVRDFLVACGYEHLKSWPRPAHTYRKDDKFRVFAVRDKSVALEIFYRIVRDIYRDDKETNTQDLQETDDGSVP